ncbi:MULTISPECIES: hypothetical protein [Halomonadaceae]|uniref:hypothetical protein n=1 Tax=Halomonadaceae TaxID=28256 RepID=UPI001599C041|nr:MULTISPECIES: hypothetical protein [Halomonas]QJQ96764.1 hypothetical protein HIO72_16745 [Halomonas sp. PA5]
MSASLMTRTYEGRMPAKPLIEQSTLWLPVEHHIEGVFENREAQTTVTYAMAQGALAEETLALAEEYQRLHRQAKCCPDPSQYFVMQEMPSLPSEIGTPVERAGWQLYAWGDEMYASRPLTQSAHVAYYQFLPKRPAHSCAEALGHFEAEIVAHGRVRIRLQQTNEQMRTNARVLRNQAVDCLASRGKESKGASQTAGGGESC